MIEDKIYDKLSKSDDIMSNLINKWGKLTLRPSDNLFEFVVREIIEQMLSIKAAKVIFDRLLVLVGDITPENILKLSPEKIKSIGTSWNKATYIIEFSKSVIQGQIDLSKLKELSDNDLIARLVSIKGVGLWTAEMIACFGLGRLNIWSYGDVALKNGILKTHPKYKTLSKKRFYAYGKKFEPYRSIAGLYFYAENDE